MENTETKILSEEEVHRKEILANKTKSGFKIILWGALILFVSGLIALFAPMSQSGFEIVMYGFSSLGAAMIIYGLYTAIG